MSSLEFKYNVYHSPYGEGKHRVEPASLDLEHLNM